MTEPTVPRRRVPQAERKRMIARAAAELFAQRGFHASGSRDIAAASGISEALMFRYFPTKDDLWAAAIESCRQNAVADTLRSIPDREPSTRALVELTLALADDFIADEPVEAAHNRDVLNRMMLRSMAEDGEFARMVRSDLSVRLARYVATCLAQGREHGDIELPANEAVGLLAVNYIGLFFFVGVQRLSRGTPSRAARQEELIEAVVRSQLRSVGMRQDVIERTLTAIDPARFPPSRR